MSDKVSSPPKESSGGVIMGRAAVSTVAPNPSHPLPPVSTSVPLPVLPHPYDLGTLLGTGPTSEEAEATRPGLWLWVTGFCPKGLLPGWWLCCTARPQLPQQGNAAGVAVVTGTQPGVGALGLPFPESPLSPRPPLMAGP